MIVFAAMAVLLGTGAADRHLPVLRDAGACASRCSPAAFNLLIGYGGLLSFGHAMFWGTARLCAARMR